jgi:hypothetical protein
MKRVLLDTNIYGEILLNEEESLVLRGIGHHRLIVYGADAIRKELRDTSKKKILIASQKKRSLRIVLLGLYDSIVKNHQLATIPYAEKIAWEYGRAYKELGGKDANDLKTDFLIVALGTVHKMDIVYSEDSRTMKNAIALKSYAIVNAIHGLRAPSFKTYGEFKNDLMSRP